MDAANASTSSEKTDAARRAALVLTDEMECTAQRYEQMRERLGRSLESARARRRDAWNGLPRR